MANAVRLMAGGKLHANAAKLLSETAVQAYAGANTHAGAETFNGTVTLNTGLDMNANASITVAFGSATEAGASATINAMAGLITTSALTDAADAVHSISLNNTFIGNGDVVLVMPPVGGTLTVGAPVITSVVASAQHATIQVTNAATAAFNGTLKIPFLVLKSG